MRALVALILLTAGLAGCIGSSGEELGPDALPVGLAIPEAPEPFAFLVCEQDELVPLSDQRVEPCNFQATIGNGPGTEVHVAVNPTNPLNLIGGSKDFTLGESEDCGMYRVWSGVYTSFDGGRTWEHQLLPGYPGDDEVTALSEYGCGSDPVIAFGPTGIAYYAGIYSTDDPAGEDPPLPQLGPIWGGDDLNTGLAVSRSLDGGRTWEPVSLRHVEDPDAIIDKEWIAVDPTSGQVYVTYVDFSADGNFYIQRSDDEGLTWTDPIRIFEPPGSMVPLAGPQFGQVVVDPAGIVHFTYWYTDDDGSTAGIWHRSSSDDGMTWSERHAVAPYYPIFDLGFTHKYRIVPNPALAVDGNDGTLYLSYPFYAAEGNVPGGNLDVFVVASSDGGVSWSAPVKVNDDLIAPLNGQWMQALAVGPDGTVHMTWLDDRDDPTGQFATVYYATSQDGGATWSANQRISDVPFDGEGGYHQSGSGTIGDYMGLAVSDVAVYPFWSDTRNGQNDVFSAIIPA